MNEIMEKEEIKIEDMIYEIRGVQVMLDSDIAKLFECKNGTKEINQAVKNNITKFPSSFCFHISEFEYNTLKSKVLTSKGGARKGHNAFTEEGVAMLTTILKTPISVKMSVKIIETFVKMRHFIMENKDIYKSLNNINNKLIEHDDKIDYIFSKFDKKEKLYLKDESFDAYYDLVEILNSAYSEIIVIDNYADITFLDLIRNIKCKIILITRDSNRLSGIEIEKYNKEYRNLEVIRNNFFHDRMIVIDQKEIYISGSSINSFGNKATMIIKIENQNTKESIISSIKDIIEVNK